jgi:phenylacetate-coenzyme A ligase PaaK-like adenylate-forming protein
MSIYEKFFSKSYPIYLWLIRRPTIEFFNARWKREQCLPSSVDAIRLEKLREQLGEASKNVAFYRNYFNANGLLPENILSMSDFSALDLSVDKSHVREDVSSFINPVSKRSDLSWHMTGGSTGEPLNFATDRKTDAASQAGIMVAFARFGVKLGARHCIFWGSPTFIDTSSSWLKSLVSRVKLHAVQILMNRRVFLNYNLSEKNMPKVVQTLNKFQPEYLRGMPSSLYAVAKMVDDLDLNLSVRRLKFIHSACEQLYPWQKECIERVFGVPVLNTYGLSEFGDIAFEAPCGNLHVLSEDVVVELNDFGSGLDEIVVTQLNNRFSPLVKYRTYDIASSVGECSVESCKIPHPVIYGLKGRVHDFIRNCDGGYLHGQAFTHVLVSVPGIVRYQVVQKRLDYLIIKLVVDAHYDSVSESKIVEALRKYLGNSMEIAVEYVDEIPLTKRGKFRWIISEIDVNEEGGRFSTMKDSKVDSI